MATTIPKGGTLVPSDLSFGIVLATDQVGGFAFVTNEAAIGAIASGRLVLGGTWRASIASGVIYAYTSATPSGGFANGTWTPAIFSGANGSFSPGAVTVTTANVTKSGEQTISGVTTSASRVLLVAQTAPAENGLWITAAGAWARASDANTAGAFVVGKTIFVTGGTLVGSVYGVSTAPTALGTDPIQWSVNTTGAAVVDLTRPGPIGSNTPNTVAATALALSGGVTWAPGAAPSFGGAVASFGSTDGDHVATATEYSAFVVNILSSVPLTATRTLTWPLNTGSPAWLVRNATTGGQAILVKGATGTGVTVPNGQSALLWTDATNIYGVSGGGDPAIHSSVVTANQTMDADGVWLVDTTGGTFTLKFPASPSDGARRLLKDVGLALETTAFTLDGNSATFGHPFTGALVSTVPIGGGTTGARNGWAGEWMWSALKSRWLVIR